MIFWTIFAGLTLMEDGFKEHKSGGVNAFRRIQRQSRYQDRKTRFPRGSEALATKLGPSFHTQPPTKYSFSNDTGMYIFFRVLTTLFHFTCFSKTYTQETSTIGRLLD